MRYVVGYVPDRGGIEAVNLATTLAGTRGATVDVVVALPVDEPTFDMYSPDKAYQHALEIQGQEWLADALAQVPDGVPARGHLRHSESITEALIQAATDPELGEAASAIVVGAAQRGLTGRFTIGGVAAALLHSSPIPVALAPRGYERHSWISRITCAMGTRAGGEVLLEVATAAAALRDVPLRLVSLVALDLQGDAAKERVTAMERHAEALLESAKSALPEGYDVTALVGTGKTTEDSVGSLEFRPDEIVLLGSSRLANHRRVFLGASANKILRALPVPIAVVPRDYEIPSDLF